MSMHVRNTSEHVLFMSIGLCYIYIATGEQDEEGAQTMKENERAAELRRLIVMLLEKITDERRLREIYLFLNRLICR